MAVLRTCNTNAVEVGLRLVTGGIQGVFEDAKVDRDGRLVVSCEEAPEQAADLSAPQCLRAVLARLRDEARVSGVVLVRDRERECGPRALAALEALLALARLLDQFGERVPSPEFPGFDAKEVAALCARCEFRPATMFPSLRGKLLGDPAGFVAALKALATSLDEYDESGCRSCAGATAQDLRVLIDDVAKGMRS